jgi:hypothetical protein
MRNPLLQVKKIAKQLQKLEQEFETAKPVRKQRIIKKGQSLYRKLDRLEQAMNPTGRK